MSRRDDLDDSGDDIDLNNEVNDDDDSTAGDIPTDKYGRPDYGNGQLNKFFGYLSKKMKNVKLPSY
jgi:hypothetical protein